MLDQQLISDFIETTARDYGVQLPKDYRTIAKTILWELTNDTPFTHDNDFEYLHDVSVSLDSKVCQALHIGN